MTHPKRMLVAGLAAALLSTLPAVSGDRWLHVKVDETETGGANVRVNLPLALVRSMLPALDHEEIRGGKVRIPELDVDGIRLDEVLRALRDAPDSEFVRINDDEEEVRISKEAGFFLVRVDARDGDRVRAKVPLAVLEALLGGGDDELDLLAGLDALAAFDGDLVTVESDDAIVRVWIDDRDTID